jgi:hypothetical protein
MSLNLGNYFTAIDTTFSVVSFRGLKLGIYGKVPGEGKSSVFSQNLDFFSYDIKTQNKFVLCKVNVFEGNI